MPGRDDMVNNGRGGDPNNGFRRGPIPNPHKPQTAGGGGNVGRFPSVAGKSLSGWKRAVFKKAGLVK